MHGLVARKELSRWDWMFLDPHLLEEVQAMALESAARSRQFYRASAAAAQGGARLFVEVAETAWGSAKLLNDKVVRNAASNAEAAFGAAEACAKAGSLLEIATLQGNFLQLLFSVTSEQSREFIDLSTRATQHVIETMHGAAARLLRTDF